MTSNTGAAKSQADVREFRIFTDQWGREWGTTVNNSGVHGGYPVGPLMLRIKPPVVAQPPIETPPPYVDIIDKAAGKVIVRTEKWLEVLELAHAAYQINLRKRAFSIYRDGAPEAIKRGDKDLFYIVGPPPRPMEQVLAYQQGHPWVLGLDAEKPKSLEPYFPTSEKLAAQAFLTAAQERLLAAQATETKPDATVPAAGAEPRRRPGRPPGSSKRASSADAPAS